MKKKLFVISIIMMILFLAITFTSCRTSGPDISHLSERFLDNNQKVKLWWDFKSSAKPFEVLFSLKNATLTTIATNLETNGLTTDVTPGGLYHWQVKGANGSASGVKEFQVPGD